MEVVKNFSEEEHKNWLKGVFLLICAQKPLELLVDNEIEEFHRQLLNQCGAAPCERSCVSLSKVHPCDVCTPWKEKIKAHHNSSNIFWKNCTPHLWSHNKWEVAKAYMPGGHETHELLGDFDIAALLGIMKNCKHFDKFQIVQFHELVNKASHARNKLMHSTTFKVKKDVLHDYAERIHNLGTELAKHDPAFDNLSGDINEILNSEFSVVLVDGQTKEEIQAHHRKELEMLQQNLENTIKSLRVTQASYRKIIMKQRTMIRHLHQYYRESQFLCWIGIVVIILLFLFLLLRYMHR